MKKSANRGGRYKEEKMNAHTRRTAPALLIALALAGGICAAETELINKDFVYSRNNWYFFTGSI